MFQEKDFDAKIYFVSKSGSLPFAEAEVRVNNVTESIGFACSGYISREYLEEENGTVKMQRLAEKLSITIFCQGVTYSPIGNKPLVLARLKAKVLPLILSDILNAIYEQLFDEFGPGDYAIVAQTVDALLENYSVSEYSKEEMSEFMDRYYERARKRKAWKTLEAINAKARYETLIKEKLAGI
jgi:hypothetical protein